MSNNEICDQCNATMNGMFVSHESNCPHANHTVTFQSSIRTDQGFRTTNASHSPDSPVAKLEARLTATEDALYGLIVFVAEISGVSREALMVFVKAKIEERDNAERQTDIEPKPNGGGDES